MRLLHLAPASRERAIERGGLRGARVTLPTEAGEPLLLRRAVFAMPVLPDYWTTHQWLRELRRGHDERMIAVHFRIGDGEPVHAGRYGQPHRLMAASEAARWVIDHPAGAQIVVPRSLARREVVRLRPLGQLVGWTESPAASSASRRGSSCVCAVCLPPGSRDLWRRVRAEIAAGLAAARRAGSEDETVQALARLELPLERARGRFAPDRLLPFTRSPHPGVRREALHLLAFHRREHAEAAVIEGLADGDDSVRDKAVDSLLSLCGPERTARLLATAGAETAERFVASLYLPSHGPGTATALEAFAGHPAPEVREAVTAAAREALDDDETEGELRERLQALADR